MDMLVLGMEVSLIGMGVVIVALGILFMLTRSMSKVLINHKNRSEKGIEEVSKSLATTIEEPSQLDKEEQISSEIIVAIATAVASTINSRSTYRIRTIKRIDYDLSPSWSRLGRTE
ncbi:MAG: hypothetical protein APF76_03140 [Desulfitibacter sp. BRH_c19]|nr:MAG: hypothetical protein APF76_03140 [Desulfitibacter sp. BRH_c19]